MACEGKPQNPMPGEGQPAENNLILIFSPQDPAS